jgi:hypothetical protein
MAIRFYPAILAFLGYNPLPEGRTTGERVRRERISRDWFRRYLGQMPRVDEATVKRLEAGMTHMARRVTDAVLRALDFQANHKFCYQ